VNLIPALIPLLGWQVLAPGFLEQLRYRLLNWALNAAVIARMEPCDVMIGMSGIALEAAAFAKKRFGARIVMERGSKHILAQDEILASVPGARRPARWAICRETESYRIADVISVPSTHAYESFACDPAAQERCFVNPYGADLSMFPLARHPPVGDEVVFVYAGTWSYEKGCDLLVQAVRAVPRIRLVHVGSMGDYEFPAREPRIQHLPKVDQSKLHTIYGSADALVLASRQDGFGMVLGQALASGLPVLCTDATGGVDLCHSASLRDRVHVVRSGTAAALAEGLAWVAARVRDEGGLAQVTQADRQLLGWSAYGKRAETMLIELCTEAETRKVAA
jgi:glycosyltransferase involved in cell wall biosynthesis